ncbi:UDP-N-acetylmuramate--L-alanine ligase, partial [Patescibacteria group bacterium]|nr:UDP-N-acetylmuramate--L-alanine ligase [Patescibacteria group bacterium]
MNWTQYNKIYFIGIGGIGISAIAKIMLELKKQVSGSDLESSSITDELQKQGAHIKIGKHQPGNIPKDVDLIIYSNAIATTNEEYKKAKKLKVPLKSYPEILGIMMANYIPIIISGTHGKSTITAMLAKIFIQAGLDPSVVIGTKIKELDGNARLGLGRYFIAEGDEYKEAFQYYNPVALVVNNIEADHLDYFIKIENILKAFEKIISGVPAGGFLIANADDKNISKLLKKAKCKVITYGINNGDYQAFHIIRHGEIIRFAIKGLERFDLILRTPGIHNIYNALAACVLSLAFGIEHATIQKALSDYKGAWRRFEIKGKKGGVTIIDDYAHHPT